LECSDALDGERHFSGTSAFRMHMSFFGELFSHLEAWLTHDTLLLLTLPPGVPAPAPNLTSNPEMLAALSRFFAVALPPVMEALQVGVAKGTVEAGLGEMVRTMRLVGPLPGFKVQMCKSRCLHVSLLQGMSRCWCGPQTESLVVQRP
jgi:hypothetical protein